MTSMSWTTTPDFAAGVLAARPAAAGSAGAAVTMPAAALAAPAFGTRAPEARVRALTADVPFGAGTATRERHIDDNPTQNKSTLGIHSPGRPLS